MRVSVKIFHEGNSGADVLESKINEFLRGNVKYVDMKTEIETVDKIDYLTVIIIYEKYL